MMDYLAVLVTACLFTVVQCKPLGFANEDEARFNQNFKSLTKDSYAEVATSAHKAMRSSCVNQGTVGDWSKITEVTVTAENAKDLQQTCGTTSICVIPKGITVELRQNLNVAALRVEGKLVWTDATQGSDEQWLCAGYATVEKGGSFVVDVTSPSKRAWVYIKANGAAHPTLGERVFGGIGNTHGTQKTSLAVSGRPLDRTWSLLAEPGKANDNTIKLMHDPKTMGWRVGDRIVIAPTAKQSTGVAGRHKIKSIKGNNVIEVTPALDQSYRAEFMLQGPSSGVGLLSAEVINLQRNVIVTGDEFSSVTSTNPLLEKSKAAFHTECRQRQIAGSVSTTCTLGLHTIMYGNVSQMVLKHTRFERCGQRGVYGHYCVHMHFMGECPDCLVKGNAIEFGMQRGIVVHETHLSTVEENVLNDVRGAHIYIEDGNEMYNHILYNVAICPWPMNDVSKMAKEKFGCTIPGTDNEQADTVLNQAGLWALSFINHVVGNRFSNSFNGMLYENKFAQKGRTGSPVDGKVCPGHSQIGHLEGNTFHGHGRFGTYFLNYIFPRHVDQSLPLNGEVRDLKTCEPLKADGSDNGFSLAITNQVDYGNAFVGFYDGGDIQYRNHLSLENNNLIYWKSTKNFADGCSAHISYSKMGNGDLALPDHQTFIFEHTELMGRTNFDPNHHCGVGTTGALCFPTYLFVNTTWAQGGVIYWDIEAKDTTHNNRGGVFTLPPNEETKPLGNFFPPGYVSAVSDYHQWLLQATDSQGAKVCVDSKTLAPALSARYGKGILCKKPIRAIRIFANTIVASKLFVKFYQGDKLVHTTQYTMWTRNSPKQGYAFPVIVNEDSYRYELSLDGSKPLPTGWVIEFSDPVIGNRWKPDTVNLSIQGRTCPGNKATSQHDRRFLHAPMTIDKGEFNYDHGLNADMWGKNGQKGHGACSGYPDEQFVDCSKVPQLKQGGQCDGQCGKKCKNGWCDCGTKQCVCNPGFTGASCDTDLSVTARCGDHGYYTGQYLGGTTPPTARACVCKPPYAGPLCNQNPCVVDGKERSCGAHGKCMALTPTSELGEVTWRCECELGYSGDKCEKNCNALCKATTNPALPFGCDPKVAGVGKPAWCQVGNGCAYKTLPPGSSASSYCCFSNCPSKRGKCNCAAAQDDCHSPPACGSDNKCIASVALPNGTPCNSVVGGMCKSGVCTKATLIDIVLPVQPERTTTTVNNTVNNSVTDHDAGLSGTRISSIVIAMVMLVVSAL